QVVRERGAGDREPRPGRVEHAAALCEAAEAARAAVATDRVPAIGSPHNRRGHAIGAGHVRTAAAATAPTAARLVERHRTVEEGERAAGIVDAAAGGRAAVLAWLADQVLGRPAPHGAGSIGPIEANGRVVLDQNLRERDLPALIEQAATPGTAPVLDG